MTGLEKLWSLIEEHKTEYVRCGEIHGRHYLELITDMEDCYNLISDEEYAKPGGRPMTTEELIKKYQESKGYYERTRRLV